MAKRIRSLSGKNAPFHSPVPANIRAIVTEDPNRMRVHQILTAIILAFFLASCVDSQPVVPTVTLVDTPSPTPSLTPSQTLSPTPSRTSTPTLTPTEKPLTLVFYGDSVLKVGDVSRQGKVGYSIVDALRGSLNPADQIITSNHGGRKAKWGYENLDKNVLLYNPEVVTLWWGLNDLGGCPGIFDRDTNRILQYELDAMLNQHLMYLRLQIEALLARSIQVIVVTPMPILGTLPWSHFDPDNALVWENDYRCDFNSGLEQLVEAQRKLVSGYAAEQKPVYLVDAWQIYKNHPNTDNMYMDIVHPGGYGAELIADGWLQVFKTLQK
jgi:lysophospholipase L1-like esterase